MQIKWMKKLLPAAACGDEERVRSAYGKAASIVGVGMNVLLFGGKMLVGMLSGSVSITADAVNNLSDASSSIISLLGFKMADKPADAEHPYGHGRYEYLASLMVAVMILVIGVELLQSSIGKILSPTEVSFSWATALVLLMSIAAKIWLAAFNRSVGREIGSKTLIAAADDSRNDVISTTAVLAAALIAHFTGVMLDGYIGAAVAVFILVSGFGLVKETIDPLLGSVPDPHLVEHIREKVLSYPGVLGMHDLIVHDYGPGRQFASVHIEMDSREDAMVSHDLIDNIERDFLREEKLHLVVHYDPVAVSDPRIAVMRTFLSDVVAQIHPKMTIHDLRIVPGPTHVNVVFDCIVPYDFPMDPKELREQIIRRVQAEYPDYYCVITLENSFTAQP